MVSFKQWAVIVLVTVLGFYTSQGNGGATLGFFVASYGLVQGYNGVDLSQRVGSYFSKTE